MASLDSLKVIRFTRDRVPNAYPGGVLPWQVYHTVRNALVQTCRQYGPTGSMGEITIVQNAKDYIAMLVQDPDAWEPGDPDPTFYILDDQLNHERYCYAELYGEDPLNPGWMSSIASTLRDFEGWGLGINNIPNAYLLIFGDRLMVKGSLARCRSAADVVSTGRRLLKRGASAWWQFWR